MMLRRLSPTAWLLVALCASVALAGPAPKVHNTTTALSCTPDPVTLDATATCTVTVTDIGGDGGPISPPEGTVSFTTANTGTFSPTSCTLSAISATSSSCSVSYTPTQFEGGSHSLTASYGGGSNPNIGPGLIWNPSSGNQALGIAYPVPTITSISPSVGLRGGAVSVTVSGSGFVSGGTALNFGADITQSNFTVVSKTEITVDLTINVAAATGPRDVTVSNPTPGGGSDTLVNGFTIENPLPQLTSLTPAATAAGSGAISVTIDGNGFVPESIAYFNGNARSTAFINSGQLVMDLLASDTAVAGSYPVTVTNPAPGGGTSNSLAFSVTVTGGTFDAVESGESPGGPIHTKLAGTSFVLDLLATDTSRSAVDTTFSGTVRVELLDASDDSAALDANGCRASWTVAASLPDQVFNSGDNGRITVSTSYASALRVARLRISYPASGTTDRQGCSSDAFAIRPTALTLASSLNNAAESGSPVEAAGNTFTMSATAIAGYDGTPQLDATALEAHADAIAIGAVSGSFGAADIATGMATGSFTYSEVGAFRYQGPTLTQDPGVHDDSFTAVDQPGGCTDDFSNTLSGGLYGCKFGNTADTQWVGRFRPHHFDVNVTEACSDASGFSYSGQPFANLTLTARNLSGNTTQNYDYKSGDLVDDNNYSNDVTLSFNGSSTEFSPGGVSFMDFSAGVYNGNNTIAYRFADPETAYTTIAPRATDADGTSSSGYLEESTEIRSGRLLISGTSATTTTDANAGLEVQTWQDDGSGVYAWLQHADDSMCTTLAQGDFSLQDFTGQLDAGETSISAFSFASPTGSITLAAPGIGNSGTVDIVGALGASDWLRFDWDSDGSRDDATGTVRFFEIFSTEEGFINRQEIID